MAMIRLDRIAQTKEPPMQGDGHIEIHA